MNSSSIFFFSLSRKPTKPAHYTLAVAETDLLCGLDFSDASRVDESVRLEEADDLLQIIENRFVSLLSTLTLRKGELNGS